MSVNAEDNNSLIWDDTLLVKAYDNSVNLAREELARRIANSTNSHVEGQSGSEDASVPVDAEDCVSPVTTTTTEQQGKPIWKVGDYARATFEDGIDYEAEIISINADQSSCKLRYIGYGNEQVVNLADLVPSWGKHARYEQVLLSKEDADKDVDDAAADFVEEVLPPTPDTRKKTRSERKSHRHHSQHHSQSSHQSLPKSSMPDLRGIAVPPPPPMPPMFATGHHKSEDSEHLSAMLMSWYMSGYYTGVYQGLQMAKKSSKSKSK